MYAVCIQCVHMCLYLLTYVRTLLSLFVSMLHIRTYVCTYECMCVHVYVRMFLIGLHMQLTLNCTPLLLAHPSFQVAVYSRTGVLTVYSFKVCKYVRMRFNLVSHSLQE